MNEYRVQKEGIVWRIIDGQAIIIKLNQPLRSESIYTLNSTGTAVWELLNKDQTTEKMKRTLINKFSGDSDIIDKDVNIFLNFLIKENLIKTA